MSLKNNGAVIALEDIANLREPQQPQLAMNHQLTNEHMHAPIQTATFEVRVTASHYFDAFESTRALAGTGAVFIASGVDTSFTTTQGISGRLTLPVAAVTAPQAPGKKRGGPEGPSEFLVYNTKAKCLSSEEDFVSPDIFAAPVTRYLHLISYKQRFDATVSSLCALRIGRGHPALAFLTPLKYPLSKNYFGAANQYLSVLTPDEVLRWAGLGVLKHRKASRSSLRSASFHMVKAALGCGEVRRGYMEPVGWVVASDRKRLRTLQRSATFRRGGRLGREHVEFELLRPRASAARWGTQGMSFTELPRPSEMRGVDTVCRRAMVDQKPSMNSTQIDCILSQGRTTSLR
ncbi:hypothetical protein EDB83DRAFT_2553385 [Lactarius deliciosus]|nr:hypothetical protein EDB83DRAFT_2553385 [Lactarius deliciosus]